MNGKRGAAGSSIGVIAPPRPRALAEHFEVEFTSGDAEALPFDDATFDCVLSTFGVMFAPRQELATSELLRVTKPGGRIALANWTPQGLTGDVFRVLSRFVPPPAGVPSPFTWGDDEELERVLVDVLARSNRATDGSLAGTGEYLEVVIEKR